MTPILMPLLTGIWPVWIRRLPHTALVWALLGVPLVLWSQEGRGAWAQQIERRVESLEDWRDANRDLMAVQASINAQNSQSIAKLAAIAEDHEKRLLIVVNTGETMVRVGGWAIFAVPVLAALLNAIFNYFMFRRQERRNGNGGGKIHAP